MCEGGVLYLSPATVIRARFGARSVGPVLAWRAERAPLSRIEADWHSCGHIRCFNFDGRVYPALTHRQKDQRSSGPRTISGERERARVRQLRSTLGRCVGDGGPLASQPVLGVGNEFFGILFLFVRFGQTLEPTLAVRGQKFRQRARRGRKIRRSVR